MARYNVQLAKKRSIHEANAPAPDKVAYTFCGKPVPEGALVWDPQERKPSGEETGFYLVPCKRCANTPAATFTFASGRVLRVF